MTSVLFRNQQISLTENTSHHKVILYDSYNKPLARFETILWVWNRLNSRHEFPVVSILPHAEPKNHRKDAPLFIFETLLYLKAFGWYEVLVTLVHDSFWSWFSILGRYKNGYVTGVWGFRGLSSLVFGFIVGNSFAIVAKTWLVWNSAENCKCRL